jgi:hypothetical protein
VRTAWPIAIPVNAQASATTPGSAVDSFSSPAAVRLKASASVPTVKNTPSA